MTIQVDNALPPNVVEIGNEITQGVVDGLMSASPAPSSGNPYATIGNLTFLPLAGGSLNTNANISVSSTLDVDNNFTTSIFNSSGLTVKTNNGDSGIARFYSTYILGTGFGGESNNNFYLSTGSVNGSTYEGSKWQLSSTDVSGYTYDGGYNLIWSLGNSGITFPDSTVQTTAATAPTFATDAQVIAGTSASTVLSPAQSQVGLRNWVVPTTLTTSVATGTVTSTGFGSRCQLTATASGQYAIVYPSNSSIATFTNSGANYTDSNFSKRIKICGRIYCSMTAGLNAYYAWGRSNNTPSTIGSPVVKGFGIRIQGTGAVELQVHNGTTLTNVTSSFTPTTNQVFDCLIDSIGDGNVNLYINGALVATSSAGATGTQAGFPLLIQELSSTASSTVGNFYVTGKTLYFA